MGSRIGLVDLVPIWPQAALALVAQNMSAAIEAKVITPPEIRLVRGALHTSDPAVFMMRFMVSLLFPRAWAGKVGPSLR
jgi:hypothetical protein